MVGVDSGAARRRIARLLPTAVYNGGTQESEMWVTRHVGFEGPCLACLYPETRDDVGALARRLGIGRDAAADLIANRRVIDDAILAAMARHGGIKFTGTGADALRGKPLSALVAGECSRQVVIEDLPEATIGFVAALCGFLMANELVKDRVRTKREGPLDPRRPAFRLDLLGSLPGPDCVESYVARRDCFCQELRVRARIAELKKE